MQARNDVTIRRDDFTAALRRILPRGRAGAVRVAIGPAGADMLRLACGPARPAAPPIRPTTWMIPAPPRGAASITEVGRAPGAIGRAASGGPTSSCRKRSHSQKMANWPHYI